MGFSASPATLGVIVMHTLLSVSSLIFKIPTKRVASGYRIWPEYRLHSIMFALRSLAGMLLTWYELSSGHEPNYLLNVAIVFATLAAADLSSAWVGPQNRSSTSRELEAGPETHFFFSAMQFHATMGCMLGVRRFSIQFLYVWIIQFNAFLMTIRRKNLVPHNPLVATYGAMLVFGFIVASYEHQRFGLFAMVNTLGNLAAVLRMYFAMPKYLLWALMAVLTQLGRASVEQNSPHAAYWPFAYGASVVALVAVGVIKINKKKGQKEQQHGQSEESDPQVDETPGTKTIKQN
jgi:hypothetical protein